MAHAPRHAPRHAPPARHPRAGALLAALLAAALCARPAAAQTDYYNTDHGRPVRIEDAYPVEYRGLELQLAPLRLERARAGVYTWGLEPQLALGVLPRTQVEVGVPLAYVDAGATRTSGVAGIALAVLHNLNVETAIPAFAVAGDLLLPVGGLGPDRAYPSLKGIATKTYRWARFHLNGQYTFGSEPAAEARGVAELSRWMGGLAVDRTFPLRSLLLTAEVFAEQPIHASEEVAWTAGTGMRYQYSPRWALDAGVGRRLTGAERAWYATFGSAYAFGLPWRGR